VTPVDVAQGIPAEFFDHDRMQTVRGIVSWYLDQKIANPSSYWSWIQTQIKQGKKILILGQIGGTKDELGRPTPLSVVNETIGELGFFYEGKTFGKTPSLKIKKKISDYVEFERKLEGELSDFTTVYNRDTQNKVYLTLQQKILQEFVSSDVVIVGPKGGYVQNGFILAEKGSSAFWRINPYRLIADIFSSSPLVPVPDVSTQSGRRIFFSHIDGDGINNISTIDSKKLSGQIVLERILRKYLYPVTVSAITADLQVEYAGRPESKEIFRDMANLPHVELASHTFSHPLIWDLNPSEKKLREYRMSHEIHEGPLVSYKIEDYKMDYQREIKDSLLYLNQEVTPFAKKNNIIFWSGDCHPTPEALALAQKYKIKNINGGWTNVTKDHSSITQISPLFRNVDGFVHVYAPNQNDNVYTNGWMGPFNGMVDVLHTFEATEKPLRIKPINLYYHFFAGEKIAGINALDTIFSWLETQKVISLQVKDYLTLIDGFLTTTIEKVSATEFFIKKNYGLRTFRVDHTSLFPDLNKSKNILGFQHYQGNLYLFLGDEEVTKVKLTSQRPTTMYLKESNARVDHLKNKGTDLLIRLKSYRPLQLTVAGLKAGDRYVYEGIVYKIPKEGELFLNLPIIGERFLRLQKIL